ncbi:hypothetical protein SUGI_0307050 [Cryptomeria japonica]|nr:hypothetical protein SUGI_0307050 [Cryptomeria japonica]
MSPHFPSTDPHKFEIVHRVFGTTHVLKTLQGLKENERAAAVNSMVYEANARIKDPVHGCAGAVDQLQKKIAELESQLSTKQEELQRMRLIVGQIASELIARSHFLYPTPEDDDMVLEDADQLWEPLWDWKM